MKRHVERAGRAYQRALSRRSVVRRSNRFCIDSDAADDRSLPVAAQTLAAGLGRLLRCGTAPDRRGPDRNVSIQPFKASGIENVAKPRDFCKLDRPDSPGVVDPRALGRAPLPAWASVRRGMCVAAVSGMPIGDTIPAVACAAPVRATASMTDEYQIETARGAPRCRKAVTARPAPRRHARSGCLPRARNWVRPPAEARRPR